MKVRLLPALRYGPAVKRRHITDSMVLLYARGAGPDRPTPSQDQPNKNKMNKTMKTRLTGPAGIAAQPQKPLTEAEKRDLLIRNAEQKFGEIAEGVIMNLCNNSEIFQPAFAEGGGRKVECVPAAEVVNYAFAIAEEYIKQRYGVTFTKKPDPNEPASAK